MWANQFYNKGKNEAAIFNWPYFNNEVFVKQDFFRNFRVQLSTRDCAAFKTQTLIKQNSQKLKKKDVVLKSSIKC